MTNLVIIRGLNTYQTSPDGAGGEHGDPVVGRDGGPSAVRVRQPKETSARMIP